MMGMTRASASTHRGLGINAGLDARCRGVAAEQGRIAPTVATPVRVAVGAGAKRRLSEEEGFYRTINAGRREHFATMDVPVGAALGDVAPLPPRTMCGSAIRVLPRVGASKLCR